jgi:hypothetical protein
MNGTTFKPFLVKVHWLTASQFGFDPLRFIRSVRGLAAYVRDWVRFRKTYAGKMGFMPCLHDRYEEAGTTKSDYFWQDLLVARWIFEARPKRHVDVGSRVDGFVAHVASYREIEVIDIRPITTKIPGIVFRQADLTETDPLTRAEGYCDSVSCLHAVEHFGLGRYGDPIDSRGYELGIKNIARLLSPGGRLYLSTPVGIERVEFNAHWVFDPRTIIDCAQAVGLQLEQLTVIGTGGTVYQQDATESALRVLASSPYNLGIFVFAKSSSAMAT